MCCSFQLQANSGRREIMSTSLFRVLAATVSASAFGALYYSPVSPLGAIWLKEVHPRGPPPLASEETDYRILITIASVLVLSVCIERYVNYRQFSTGRLLQMACELTLLAFLLQLPHTLFSNYSIHAFVVEQIHNALVVLLITFILGYNRTPEDEIVYEYVRDEKYD